MFNLFKYSYKFKIINKDIEFNSSKIVDEKTIILEDGTKIYTTTIERDKPIPPAKYHHGFARIKTYKLFGLYILNVTKTPRW